MRGRNEDYMKKTITISTKDFKSLQRALSQANKTIFEMTDGQAYLPSTVKAERMLRELNPIRAKDACKKRKKR